MIPANSSPWGKHPLLCIKICRLHTSVIFFFLLTLTTLLLLSSCGNSKKSDTEPKDTSFIRLPASKEIDVAQKQRISNACQLWYDTVLKNSNFSGGMLVAKNGNIVFEKYKTSEIGPATDSMLQSTPLHIASVTKTFTAMAILKLAQENRLNIDDSLVRYFPDFNYPGVTIKSLLNHRSGLPNYLYFMDYLGWDKSAFITWLNAKVNLKTLA